MSHLAGFSHFTPAAILAQKALKLSSAANLCLNKSMFSLAIMTNRSNMYVNTDKLIVMKNRFRYGSQIMFVLRLACTTYISAVHCS